MEHMFFLKIINIIIHKIYPKTTKSDTSLCRIGDEVSYKAKAGIFFTEYTCLC